MLLRVVLWMFLSVCAAQVVVADTGVNQATRADQAFAKYGLTGKRVIVAVLDRGIDYTHPDFRHANGTTRIKKMWDMSAQNVCSPSNPPPVVYTEARINAALSGGPPLAERDAVGHGTVTAGIAAGSGRAVLPSSLQYAGLAPEADLLIVKVTSEGAPAHGSQPAETPFQGCYDQALDLVVQEAATLGKPIVALINSGVQWGPINGTSAVSRKIDSDFGLSNPGHVYVEASGDDGGLANHARRTYNTNPTVFPLGKSHTDTVYLQAWYTGSVPANATFRMNDNGATATAGPGNNCASSGDGSITVCQYLPQQQFYPWTSSGPDRAVWIRVVGHSGTGSFTIQATQNGTGVADVYSDAYGIVTYTNFLTPGRLTDYSSTFSAIVAACYNLRTSYTDINNIPRGSTNEGATGALWIHSSGGPTRDGRVPPNGGVDVATPGGNLFAAYGLNTYWETLSSNLIQGGNGYYGRQSATSGASPILEGAVALLLQMNPRLTGSQIRQYLHQSAVSDSFTGVTPNQMWGLGKINVLGAANLVAAGFNTNPTLSATSLTFPATPVNTTSAPRTVTFSNAGTATDALGITSVTTTGDFHITNNTCGSSLAAGANCAVTITFRPSTTGTRTSSLTFKDFNTHSPHTVSLTGTGLTPTGAPVVTTNPATNAASFSATLNGTVNPHGLTTSVYFQYGTTTSYGSNTASHSVNGSTYQNVLANISGLSASTTYHFRIVASNSADTTFGADRTFTTLSPTGLPIVRTDAATNVASHSATLNGLLNPHGLTTTVYFKWGTTTSYGHTTPVQTQTGNTYRNITANISGLTSHHTYHFRIVATNSAGTRMG